VIFGSRISSINRPPIRLSYHSRSHYNAIIHPTTHASSILASPPGVTILSFYLHVKKKKEKDLNYAQLTQEVEDHRIRLNARPTGGLEQATFASDIEATEHESLQLALQVSRQEFASRRQANTIEDSLAAALKESLKQHHNIQVIITFLLVCLLMILIDNE
jgi:hypothetical protein